MSIIGCYTCLLKSQNYFGGKEITCSSSSSSSKGSRGFGAPQESAKKQEKNNKPKIPTLQSRKSSEAPVLNNQIVDKKFSSIAADVEFEERLQAIKRSALEHKKLEEETTQYGPIDYDAPIVSENKQVGVATKLGVGIAVVVFGLVFALGDFLPTTSSNDADTVVETKLTEEEKVSLKSRLEQYEKQLSVSPEDPVSLEAAAVTLSELGQYDRAASLLEKLSKEKPSDPDVYRLLGEVKYELKDYQGSVAAYKSSASVSETSNFEVLRGLTNSLLAAKKPDEAVQVLLTARERLNTAKSQADVTGKSQVKMKDDIDPIQVELLLGKAYSDWGHVGDAVTVYDQLISANPEDFRGYLAKGIILKENGKTGDAERMFIQARFFAPYKAKTLVDRYSKQ